MGERVSQMTFSLKMFEASTERLADSHGGMTRLRLASFLSSALMVHYSRRWALLNPL